MLTSKKCWCQALSPIPRGSNLIRLVSVLDIRVLKNASLSEFDTHPGLRTTEITKVCKYHFYARLLIESQQILS